MGYSTSHKFNQLGFDPDHLSKGPNFAKSDKVNEITSHNVFGGRGSRLFQVRRPGSTVLTSTFAQVHGELEQEHRELMLLTERIRTLRSHVGLTPLLEELHRTLIRHFSREQFPGGLYECMGAYGSRYHEELKGLVRDHCLILSAVSGLLERARAATRHDEPTLLSAVAEILADLHDHESREHALADKLKARIK